MSRGSVYIATVSSGNGATTRRDPCREHRARGRVGDVCCALGVLVFFRWGGGEKCPKTKRISTKHWQRGFAPIRVYVNSPLGVTVEWALSLSLEVGSGPP